ncbi:MAG TPA: hypothetical protein VJN01_13110 [Xanthomonadales bacterium]|nr:hypothetical protein [Xanthomonadales bacterium]
MNKLGLYGTLCLFCLIFAGQLFAQQAETETETLSREETITLDLVSTISAINPETREIQLKDAEGNVRTVTADPRVKRFDELKVGDQVNATIEVNALAELRAPTEAELASLGESKLGVVRTPGDGPLAGSMAESATSVVMIVGLSLIGNIVTVMTVDGELVDVQAQSEDNLKKLRLGDTVVVTYTTSIVASVTPVAAAGE